MYNVADCIRAAQETTQSEFKLYTQTLQSLVYGSYFLFGISQYKMYKLGAEFDIFLEVDQRNFTQA